MGPIIIGLYGIPGCGKSHLLVYLAEILQKREFFFCEETVVLGLVCPDGLEAFDRLSLEEQLKYRERAVRTVQENCVETGKAAILTGHAVMYDSNSKEPFSIWTRANSDVFTHMIYLNVPPQRILEFRHADSKRRRSPLSVETLRAWQDAERKEIEAICLGEDILLHVCHGREANLVRLAAIIRDFRSHTESRNLTAVKQNIDRILTGAGDGLRQVFIIDADKTLAERDPCDLFWRSLARLTNQPFLAHSLNFVSSENNTSYSALRQAMLLYENAATYSEFDAAVQTVVAGITFFGRSLELLKMGAKHSETRMFLLTSGPSLIWQKILGVLAEREQNFHYPPAIIGGQLGTGTILTPFVKAEIVAHMQEAHGVHVSVFSDGRVDMDMLQYADDAIVVVGNQRLRTTSLDSMLGEAIRNQGLQASQLLVNFDRPHYHLGQAELPIVALEHIFLDRFAARASQRPKLLRKVLSEVHPGEANTLMIPMRDNKQLEGTAFRLAHQAVGNSLALRFVGEFTGDEKCDIKDVPFQTAEGCRLLQSNSTLIIAIKNGGEPLALGVSKVFALASYKHAQHPNDLKHDDILGIATVVLVASMVDEWTTIAKFVRRAWKLNTDLRIAIVAGVVQKDHLDKVRRLGNVSESDLTLIALHISDNQPTVEGATNTSANRLLTTPYFA